MYYGKAIKELIEWQFDPELEDSRQEIREFGMTEKDIREDGIERYQKAYYPPEANEYALRVYSFFRQNENCVLTAGGMQHVITGLDKVALSQIAPLYGLDFGALLPFANLYEAQLLSRQQRDVDTRSNVV